MTAKLLLSALASVALVSAGAAAAGPGKGARHGPSVGAKGKPQSNAKGKGRTKVGKAMRTKGRANSQGPAHASARALERASANSVLAGNRIVDGPLTGLAVGAPISVDGKVVGTVERIVPEAGRRVSNVLVRTTSRRIVPLSPRSLELESGVWTADSLRPSANRR